MSKRTTLIFTVLVGYIILQFLWWEVLLVRQSNQIISEKQKLAALSSTDDEIIKRDINALQEKKTMKLYMITGEGTVFLLILLFGVYQVRKSVKKETELAQQQKNFTLSVSHELKTPIAATKLQLQTMLKHDLNREKQIELLNNALNETERLAKLVENVLMANQIENNNLSVNIEKIDLSEFVEKSITRYFSEYLHAGHLKMRLIPHIEYAVDKDLFPSILINLIENAVKYSDEQVNIEVSLKIVNHKPLLEIKDQGAGISEDEKQKVFQKFFRSGNENTRKTKGTGIGLFIVKYICDLHQAKIHVFNNSPKGTIFQIQF